MQLDYFAVSRPFVEFITVSKRGPRRPRSQGLALRAEYSVLGTNLGKENSTVTTDRPRSAHEQPLLGGAQYLMITLQLRWYQTSAVLKFRSNTRKPPKLPKFALG